MAERTRHIPVDKNSELGRQLDAAAQAGEPVVLVVNGQSFRLTPQVHAVDDPWAGYDPEQTRAALRASAGALKHVDRDQLVRDIYDARGQDSHGRPA